MKGRQRAHIVLALIVGLSAAALWIGLLGIAPARAEQGATVGDLRQPPPPPPPNDDDLQFIAFFTDELPVQISDLSGNIVAEGRHSGEARCSRSSCNHKAEMVLLQSGSYPTPYQIEYRFTDRLALDPEASRAILAGTGTVGSDGQKLRFRFTATIQDNRDGSLTVRYEASVPDASFIVSSRGSMSIFSR